MQVDIEINDAVVDVAMKLGDSGEAFFVDEDGEASQVRKKVLDQIYVYFFRLKLADNSVSTNSHFVAQIYNIFTFTSISSN